MFDDFKPECSKCPDPCKKCTSLNKCSECNSGYLLDAEI